MQAYHSLKIELAPTGRSRCGVCKDVILKDEERFGTQRKYPFKGFVCTTWHHRACFERPWSLEIGESNSTKNASDSYAAFAKAARLAVLPSVRSFREKSLDVECPICPIMGEKLNATNSHVHHFGPYDFRSITKSFIKEFNVATGRISYTAAQFSDSNLESSFANYHEEKKRYLLVHMTANEGVLKRKPNFGPCDCCSTCHRLAWIFDQGFCRKCRKSKEVRRKFLSTRQCNKEFGLTAQDLVGEKYQEMDNPISPNFHKMRLYRRSSIEAIATKKFGSIEAAHLIQESKRIRRREQRDEVYAAARAFHMQLRCPRKTKIASSHHDEFATPGQLRYLRDLDIAFEVGLSKSAASEAISKATQSKKRKKR